MFSDLILNARLEMGMNRVTAARRMKMTANRLFCLEKARLRPPTKDEEINAFCALYGIKKYVMESSIEYQVKIFEEKRKEEEMILHGKSKKK